MHRRKLQFGVHLSEPGDVAAEARAAEALGFDLAAVDRDVLGSSETGLEMWTTLTWVAARTSTISVLPNVLALPNRHPALVAKMAATLDRLSGGRLVLTLGAGAPINDAAVHALGLHQWSPAERVDATGEAIDVIRGLWNEPSLSYSGRYFVTERASMQPKPEHPIPIWLGAYRPRMLDLVGKRGDGWLPSLFLLEPEAAYRALDRVRAAARRAGRDPDRLTFAYNVSVLIDEHAAPQPGQVVGSGDHVADKLVEFAEHGFTCLLFWFSGQKHQQMERMARDVIPTVRERVHGQLSWL